MFAICILSGKIKVDYDGIFLNIFLALFVAKDKLLYGFICSFVSSEPIYSYIECAAFITKANRLS